MAMSVGGNKRGFTAEPNVVPMIDILLVLLIIFMILQPQMRKAVDLQLPDPNPSVAPANAESDQIVLEVGPGEKLAINKEPVTWETLGTRLKGIYDVRPDKIMFVKGDPAVKYQKVIEAMDISRGSGVAVIGVVPKETSE
jgi:biopolymer transport protein ExbD